MPAQPVLVDPFYYAWYSGGSYVWYSFNNEQWMFHVDGHLANETGRPHRIARAPPGEPPARIGAATVRERRQPAATSP